VYVGQFIQTVNSSGVSREIIYAGSIRRKFSLNLAVLKRADTIVIRGSFFGKFLDELCVSSRIEVGWKTPGN
jgi:hypothetical protein